MEKILEVKNLYKSFGKKQILNDVSFEINEGDILAFIGPNGSGKTTTIKLLLGLQSIDKGTVIINGNDVKRDYIKAISKVGSLVENPDNYMYLTGWQNLKLLASCHKGISEKYLEEIVELVGLTTRINDKVNKYSLGMRQRLGIAKALVNKPNVLILDEPTNGLDPEGIKDLRNLLKKLASKGMGVLISSHNLAELESFCNKVLVIDKGTIIESSKVTDFKRNEGKYHFNVDDTSKFTLDGAYDINETSFCYNGNKEDIARLIKKLVEADVNIYGVYEDELTLEEAFLKKTGGKK